MKNNEFNEILRLSFLKYLESGSSRSNEKLKLLHGFIANKIKNKLNNDYIVTSINDIDSALYQSKEKTMNGLYMNKKVDIVISKLNNQKQLEDKCGIAIKFIMSNYDQNSNNYFENMLGETANIRGAGYPYFQILIIDSEWPYFKAGNEKIIKNWESLKTEKLKKYQKLSYSDTNQNKYVPNKMMLYVYKKEFFNKIKNIEIKQINNFSEYKNFCLQNDFCFIENNLKNFKYGDNIIFNDFDLFLNFVVKEVNKNKNKKKQKPTRTLFSQNKFQKNTQNETKKNKIKKFSNSI